MSLDNQCQEILVELEQQRKAIQAIYERAIDLTKLIRRSPDLVIVECRCRNVFLAANEEPRLCTDCKLGRAVSLATAGPPAPLPPFEGGP